MMELGNESGPVLQDDNHTLAASHAGVGASHHMFPVPDSMFAAKYGAECRKIDRFLVPRRHPYDSMSSISSSASGLLYLSSQ